MFKDLKGRLKGLKASGHSSGGDSNLPLGDDDDDGRSSAGSAQSSGPTFASFGSLSSSSLSTLGIELEQTDLDHLINRLGLDEKCLKMLHTHTEKLCKASQHHSDEMRNFAGALMSMSDNFQMHSKKPGAGEFPELYASLRALGDFAAMVTQIETSVMQRIRDTVSDAVQDTLKKDCEAADKSLKSLEKARVAAVTAAQKVKDAESRTVAWAQGNLSKQQLEVAQKLEAKREDEAKRSALKRHTSETVALVSETTKTTERAVFSALSELTLTFHLYHQQLGTMAKALVDQLAHLSNARLQALNQQRDAIANQRAAAADVTSKFHKFSMAGVPAATTPLQVLAHSERLYIQRLEELVDLEKDVRQDPRLLSKFGGDQNPLEAVFYKLQPLFQFHQSFLVALQQPGGYQQALATLVQHAPTVYVEYATNFARAIYIISTTASRSKSFTAFLASVEGKFGQPLVDLLSLPRNRLNYYLQFVEHVAPQVPALQPLCEPLHAACQAIQNKNQVSERMVVLYRIQSKLVLPASMEDMKLAEAHRYLIREGPVRLVDNEQYQQLVSSGAFAASSSASASSSPTAAAGAAPGAASGTSTPTVPAINAYLFLFNDSVIVAQRQGLIGTVAGLVGRKSFDELLGDKLTYAVLDRITFGSGTSRLQTASDANMPSGIVLTQAHKTVRLLFNSSEELQTWSAQFSAALRPSPTTVFGVPLLQLMVNSGAGRDIPYVLEATTFALNQRHLREEGLFRLSGQSTLIEELQLLLDRGEAVDLSHTDHNVIAGLLKQWLRALPEPLMTNDMFAEFFQLGLSLPGAKSQAKHEGFSRAHVQSLVELVGNLPRYNAFALQHLMRCLSRTAAHADVNKMSSTNLATIFGPTLLSRPGASSLDTSDFGPIFALVRLMIENYDVVFASVEKQRQPGWDSKSPTPPTPPPPSSPNDRPVPSSPLSSSSLSSLPSSPALSRSSAAMPDARPSSPAAAASPVPVPAVQLPPCARCSQPIQDCGVEALGVKWHVACFVCQCGAVLAETGFVEINQRAWCGSCAQKYMLWLQQQRALQQQQQSVATTDSQQVSAAPVSAAPVSATPVAASPAPVAATPVAAPVAATPSTTATAHAAASAALICAGCNQPLVRGQRAMKAMDKCWHFDCFNNVCRCHQCHGDLTKGYAEVQGRAYCASCIQATVAQKRQATSS